MNAYESDPVRLGWMQGFPPPPDKRLSAADGSFFQFPALRYSVAHMREFLPTVAVSRGLGTATPLPYRLDPAINGVKFVPAGASSPMDFETSLGQNYTDGIVVLHRGDVVYERYFGALTPDGQHAAMSVSKSFAGTLASILVAEGTLDAGQLVVEYVPELKGSAFGDATVRQVMDMTTALQFSEDYADPKAEIWAYSAAGSPWAKPAGDDGADGYFAYLKTVKKQGEHGNAFGYRTVNSDALAWIMARATGKSVAQLLSEKIWQPLGMEQDAYYQVDALGTPFAGGGLNLGLRDLARFGEMLRLQGQWQGRQVIPKAAVTDIEQGGSKNAFSRSNHPELPGWSYRNMWWVTENAHGAYSARGVHGQALYIDPQADMVIARFASHPVAANSANDPMSLPAYAALARYLMDKAAGPALALK